MITRGPLGAAVLARVARSHNRKRKRPRARTKEYLRAVTKRSIAPTANELRTLTQTYVGQFSHELGSREPRHATSLMADVLLQCFILGVTREFDGVPTAPWPKRRWFWNPGRIARKRKRSATRTTNGVQSDIACAVCKSSARKCPMHRKHG